MRTKVRCGSQPLRRRKAAADGCASGTSTWSGPRTRDMAAASSRRAAFSSQAHSGPSWLAVRPSRPSRAPPRPYPRAATSPLSGRRPARRARMASRRAPNAAASSAQIASRSPGSSGRTSVAASSSWPAGPVPTQRWNAHRSRKPMRRYIGRPCGVASRSGVRPCPAAARRACEHNADPSPRRRHA